MTIVIEDGTVVDGANSYITLEEAEAHVVDMGYIPTASILEGHLIQSFHFMQSLPWCLSRSAPYTVTTQAKSAQAEIAFQVSEGFAIGGQISADRIKRERLEGVAEVEYFEHSGRSSDPFRTLKQLPFAMSLLDAELCPDCGEYLKKA